MDELKILTGRAHPKLAGAICKYVGVPLGQAQIGRFPNGEISLRILDDIRGADLFLVQPTCPPPQESLVELLVMIDCVRRASAARVTAVIPDFGYARQDRKDVGRVPISAKLIANLLVTAGVHRVLTVDLHAPQIQGFFDIPVDHLIAAPLLAGYLNSLDLRDYVVVSPDVGRIKTAESYCRLMKGQLAIVDKTRLSGDETRTGAIIGPVEGRHAILVDDTIHTAGTICEAAKALKAHGARDIYVAATHGVFCGPAFERLREAPIKEIVVTDTNPIPEDRRGCNITVISVAPLLGEAIRRIHANESVSGLFGNLPAAEGTS